MLISFEKGKKYNNDICLKNLLEGRGRKYVQTILTFKNAWLYVHLKRTINKDSNLVSFQELEIQSRPARQNDDNAM